MQTNLSIKHLAMFSGILFIAGSMNVDNMGDCGKLAMLIGLSGLGTAVHAFLTKN